jgi:hypothetical protein
MTIQQLTTIERRYKNNGQEAERVVRYTLTGEDCKADNLEHSFGGDCGSLQIKSARATVCKGLDLNSYLAEDAATEYGYVISDFSRMYVMNVAEYVEFIKAFATATKESQKNGGGEKLRLKHETKAMLEWLRVRAGE